MKLDRFKSAGTLAIILLVGFLGAAMFLAVRDVYGTYTQAKADASRTQMMWEFVAPIMQQQLAQRQAQQQPQQAPPAQSSEAPKGGK